MRQHRPHRWGRWEISPKTGMSKVMLYFTCYLIKQTDFAIFLFTSWWQHFRSPSETKPGPERNLHNLARRPVHAISWVLGCGSFHIIWSDSHWKSVDTPVLEWKAATDWPVSQSRKKKCLQDKTFIALKIKHFSPKCHEMIRDGCTRRQQQSGH